MLGFLLRKREKKGFTLIELIVVLVILAILAAAAIPAMMGYVEKARAAQHYAELRAVIVATKVALTLTLNELGSSSSQQLYYDPGHVIYGTGHEPIDKCFERYLEDAIGTGIDTKKIVIVMFLENNSVRSMAISLFLSDKGIAGNYFSYREGAGISDSGKIYYYENGKLVE